MLTGFLVPTSGKIEFRGQDITGLQPALVAKQGMVRTFQNIRLFGSLSVLQNVQTAAQMRTPKSLGATLFGLPSFQRREAATRAHALELLEFLDLADYADHAAGSLPYGHQRRLEIARALATEPALLLLDEPAAGMNPTESDGAAPAHPRPARPVPADHHARGA